jgi:hypothetical protein
MVLYLERGAAQEGARASAMHAIAPGFIEVELSRVISVRKQPARREGRRVRLSAGI